MWTRVVCLLVLIHISTQVTVKVGDFTFPLETVKKFKEAVIGKGMADERVQSDDIYEKICSKHALPELQDLCDTKQPNLITETLRGLELVAYNMDVCEVCALAGCSGC